MPASLSVATQLKASVSGSRPKMTDGIFRLSKALRSSVSKESELARMMSPSTRRANRTLRYFLKSERLFWISTRNGR